jgi:hypothetical protein
MFKAKLESQNFTFEAYGRTARHALDALKQGFEDHAEQYGIAPDWWIEWESDIFTTKFDMEVAYRDNERIAAGLLSKQKGVNYDSDN